MLQVVLACLTGLLCVLSLAGPSESENDALQRCLSTCDQAGSETDQATCRLTCQQEDWAPKEPNITRWKKTELLGGSPDPSAGGGSTTEVEETSSRGRTHKRTEVTGRAAKTSRSASTRTPTPAVSQLQCQAPCALEPSVGRRALCRFDCVVRSNAAAPPPRKPTNTTATTRPSTSGCKSACLSKGDSCRTGCTTDGSDATTCELQCNQVQSRCMAKCG